MKPASLLPPLIIIASITFLFLGIAGAVYISDHQQLPPVPAQRSDPHESPPPGYAIQTNGQGQWRWFRVQHGDRDSWAPMDSRQDAVESAWIWYNYDHAVNQTWRIETPMAGDPNAGLIEIQIPHKGMP